MNPKIQISNHEIENDKNMLNHYMHVCSPIDESQHEHHDHDHHHQSHHDHGHENHDENEHVYCCGHHEHHKHDHDHDEDHVHHEHTSDSNCFGIHMHGKHHNRNHDNVPLCGMMHGNVPYGMPLMIELEDDDDDGDDDKISDILEKLEKHNPEILSLMAMYGIAYPAAAKLLKRIIKATLHNK